MNNWTDKFLNDDIFFVTPDVKWGLGLTGILPRYHIICADFDPIIPILRKQGGNIFCLEEKIQDIKAYRNSGKLLESKQVLSYIRQNVQSTPKIMYFKPSLILDKIITDIGFFPIGNKAKLNELFEDKVNFYKLAQNKLFEFLLPGEIGILEKLNYSDLVKKLGTNFVVQFGHGWAGKTTFFIKDELDFNKLKEKFPYTKVKVGKFIRGFTVLNNCCIYRDKIFISLPAIQIDGIDNLSENTAMTCGRQWPVKFIDSKQEETISQISQIVGNMMKDAGFKGFFGIDFLIDVKSGKVYLSEVNARMTASAPFFTLLQIGAGETPFLAYHLAEFLGKDLPKRKFDSSQITGSQIILRRPLEEEIVSNRLYGVFKYERGKPKFIKDDYYPERLKDDEFIFMSRKKDNKNADDETARIEVKNEVLDSPKVLKEWVERLLNN